MTQLFPFAGEHWTIIPLFSTLDYLMTIIREVTIFHSLNHMGQQIERLCLFDTKMAEEVS